MTGERDLAALLAGLDPELDPETYVFATYPDETPEDMSWVMQVREPEGLTVVLPAAEADRLAVRAVFPSRRIILRIHSALDAVGMMAAVATALARAGIATNPVSGYFHDHIFVADGDADKAMQALQELVRTHRAEPDP